MAVKVYSQQVVTPRGTFLWPHLIEPDTRYDKPHGKYKMTFAVDADDASDFIEELSALRDEFVEEEKPNLKPAARKKAALRDFYEEEFDEEGNETGRLLFKFKLDPVVEGKTKTWTQSPVLFDAGNNPITEDIQPWTGTEGKVSLEVVAYFGQDNKEFGLSLRMKFVQILKLKEGGNIKNGAAAGFGVEEDGYISNSEAAVNGFGDESEEAAEDDDGEF